MLISSKLHKVKNINLYLDYVKFSIQSKSEVNLELSTRIKIKSDYILKVCQNF